MIVTSRRTTGKNDIDVGLCGRPVNTIRPPGLTMSLSVRAVPLRAGPEQDDAVRIVAGDEPLNYRVQRGQHWALRLMDTIAPVEPGAKLDPPAS